MNRDMESAFADEVLAEIAAQRGLTAKEVQRRTGITQSTWGNYFVQRTTSIKLGAMLAVCDVLGVPAEEMIARARVRADRNAAAEPVDELEAGLSPSGRRALEKGRAAVREELDPQGTAREGARRSA